MALLSVISYCSLRYSEVVLLPMGAGEALHFQQMRNEGPLHPGRTMSPDRQRRHTDSGTFRDATVEVARV